MGNTYRATTREAVAAYDAGVFERDFTVVEEQDALSSGLLELVPRTYKVLSNNYEVPQGEEFEAAFRIETEAALIDGGHIRRVNKRVKPDDPEDKPADGPTTKKGK